VGFTRCNWEIKVVEDLKASNEGEKVPRFFCVRNRTFLSGTSYINIRKTDGAKCLFLKVNVFISQKMNTVQHQYIILFVSVVACFQHAALPAHRPPHTASVGLLRFRAFGTCGEPSQRSSITQDTVQSPASCRHATLSTR